MYLISFLTIMLNATTWYGLGDLPVSLRMRSDIVVVRLLLWL